MLCIENVVGIDGHGSGTPKIQIYYIHKIGVLPSYIKTYPFWKIFLTVNELGRFILLYAFLNELKTTTTSWVHEEDSLFTYMYF